MTTVCPETNCNMKCVAPECGNLCYHQYRCDSSCYDYTNGHICKHLHRVHSMNSHRDQHSGWHRHQHISGRHSFSPDSTPQSAFYHLPQNSGKSTSGLISFSTLQYTRYTNQFSAEKCCFSMRCSYWTSGEHFSSILEQGECGSWQENGVTTTIYCNQHRSWEEKQKTHTMVRLTVIFYPKKWLFNVHL